MSKTFSVRVRMANRCACARNACCSYDEEHRQEGMMKEGSRIGDDGGGGGGGGESGVMPPPRTKEYVLRWVSRKADKAMWQAVCHPCPHAPCITSDFLAFFYFIFFVFCVAIALLWSLLLACATTRSAVSVQKSEVCRRSLFLRFLLDYEQPTTAPITKPPMFK